jgi:hypothetical protein
MAQRVSGYERQANETYETPAWCARVVADHYLHGRCTHLWEPANGPNSKLARALQAEGFNVLVTNTNFLTMRELPDPRIEAVTTNPPYGHGRLAHQFISHALNLAPIVAMLLTADFDSGKTRTSLFRVCKLFVGKIVLLDRVVWFERPGADPSTNHAWFIWHRGHVGEPTIRYARRPQ